MERPNPRVKARELIARYGTKQEALIQAEQILIMSPIKAYWEEVTAFLKE